MILANGMGRGVIDTVDTTGPNGSSSIPPDPTYDATHATAGGDDTESVLISPYITPGTVSSTFYNHQSWLQTMEDLFGVDHGGARTAFTVGTVCGSIDNQGNLAFAAQVGRAQLGADVFTNAGHRGRR